MKSTLKYILQKLFGLEQYLYLFANYIIFTLPFNRKESDFLHFIKLIKKDGIILDIGANLGIMTYYLSKQKPDSQIFSFEPVQENLKILKKIVQEKKLNNVEVFDIALGNKNESGTMVLPEVNHVVMQGLSHVVHESIPDFNQGKTMTIEIKKLDDLQEIIHSKKPVIGIKLDVENYESFVLEGATSTINKYKPIIYTELWENENRTKCIKILTEMNYFVKVLEGKNLVDFDPKKHKTQNFFFLP
ncbi:MAG: FkbM family methyltransferase [Bacteroidales bacterium]|nr:FkbM family methyltransferase [Bacteroidales bacterium]